MKKLLLASALAISTVSFAQIDFRSTRFGATLGGNYSRVKNAHNPSGPRYTFQAGVLALVPIGSENQFFLQPELVYFGAGETGKDKDAKSYPGYDAVYANNYLSVPISFKGYFSEAESEFFGLVGPRFNFLLSQNVKNAPKVYYTKDQIDPNYPNVNGKASSFNFGLGIGVGYSYKRQLELTARYDFGLSNTYPGLGNEPKGSDKSKSEQVLSISLSYIFQ